MSSFQAPPLTKVNKVLLITLVSLFLIHSIGQALGWFSLVQWFGLLPGATFPLRLHTLVTYPWVETQLMAVMFNGLALWFLGSELEGQWGPRVYLKFLFTSIFLAGLVYLFFAVLFLRGTWLGGGVLVGSAGFTYALCTAYAVLYPERQFLLMFAFPVKAKWFCLIMAGVELYIGVFSGNPASWGHLFSMGIAFLLIRHQTWTPIRWWLKESVAIEKGGKKRDSQHLRLVKGDDDKPKYWH